METYYGHIGRLGSIGSIKEILARQASEPSPCVSNNFYYSANDFFQHLSVTAQLSKSRPYKFPDGFKEFSHKTGHREIFNEGYLKFSVTKVRFIENNHFNIDDETRAKLIIPLSKELRDKFNLKATYIETKVDISGALFTTDRYIACLTRDIVKNEKGEWTTIKKDKAEAQFFGFLVAKGIIDEKFLLDSPVALGKNYHQILSVIKQLRDEGVKPILKEPIHKYKNPNELSR
jgi:hypothetical protein